jgi:hypothetical protein
LYKYIYTVRVLYIYYYIVDIDPSFGKACNKNYVQLLEGFIIFF